jgi:hypothetical protein
MDPQTFYIKNQYIECTKLRIYVFKLIDYPTVSFPYRTSGLKIKSIHGKKLMNGSSSSVVVNKPLYYPKSYLFVPDHNLIYICIEDVEYFLK